MPQNLEDPVEIADLARRAAGRQLRLYGLAIAGLSLSLMAGANQPGPAGAVTRLAGSLKAVSVRSASSAWAVGQTDAAKTLALRWNGARWTRVLTPSPGLLSALSGVSMVSASNVWAVGYHARSGSKTLILHWNGTRWALVPSPSPNLV